MNEHVWALVNLIFAIAGAILAIVTGIRSRKQKKQGNDSDMREKKRRLGWIIAVIVLAVAGIIVFFLTEDMSGKMVFVDRWTIVNAVIFALGIASYVLAFKWEKDED